MSEGLLDRVFGRKKKKIEGYEDYLDLGKKVDERSEDETQADMLIRVAEIRETDDLSRVKEEIYDGNVVVMDITPIKDDEVLKDRVIDEVKRVTRDVDGDVAGLGKRQVIVTPAKVKVNRKKIVGGDFRG